jgi:hypothetical protein
MNKSTTFKKAHELAKSVHVAGDCYRVTFGAALKIVIAETKTKLVLTGSEKQITWANELLAKFLVGADKSLPTLIERMNDDVENFDGCSDEYIAEFRLAHKNVIEWLQEGYKSKTSASFWIDNKGRKAWDVAVRVLEKADPFEVDYSLVWAE